MSNPFSIGVTRDFLTSEGKLSYKDIGLKLLDAESRCQYDFLSEVQNPVPPAQIAPLEGVLSLGVRWNASTFAEGADRLLIVARFGVGYDMCDVAALTANGVLLTIARGATDLPVAGGVLAMMLGLSRRLFVKDRLVREGRWNDRAHHQGTEMAGKTLGIVGFGGAGKELWRLVQPFRMEGLVYDPFTSDETLTSLGAKRATSLEEVFSQSDYISLHCPLDESTQGLIHRGLFALMKPTAYFFNAARGPIVVEADLIAALQAGQMAGAGIDVFEQEPPSLDNPLLKMDNVILAPHAVCWTDECFQAIGETAVRSLLTVLRGETPYGLINPEVLEQPKFQAKLKAMRERVG